MKEVDNLRQSYERLVGKYKCENLIKSAQEENYGIESFEARRIKNRCKLIIDAMLAALEDRCKNLASKDELKLIRKDLEVMLLYEFDLFYISNKNDWTYRVFEIDKFQFLHGVSMRILLENDYVTFVVYETYLEHVKPSNIVYYKGKQIAPFPRFENRYRQILNLRYRINPNSIFEFIFPEMMLDEILASYIFNGKYYIEPYMNPISYAMNERASFVLSIERSNWSCNIEKDIGTDLMMDIGEVNEDTSTYLMKIKRTSHAIFQFKK